MSETEKPHLSQSAMQQYIRCGVQYEFRRIKGLKRPPGVAVVIGIATHEPIEADLKSKMEWNELLSDDEVKQTAAESVRRLWSEMDPVIDDGDPDQGQAVDVAVSLATLHHQEVAPKIAPIAVERAFCLEVPDSPYDIHGVIDVEEKDLIRDTKTAGKAPSADAVATSIQADIYTLEAKTRGEEKPFALDYLIKGKKPRTVTLEASKTDADHASFLRRFEAVANGIKAGVFMPADPTSFWCSARFCGYWDICDFGAKKKVTVGLIDPKRLTSKAIERKTGPRAG